MDAQTMHDLANEVMYHLAKPCQKYSLPAKDGLDFPKSKATI